MRRALAISLVAASIACTAAHPTDERYPFCAPGARCPIAGYRCADTSALGMRCLPPCVFAWDCMPEEVCLYLPHDVTVRACFPPGLVPAGAPCARGDDCVAGHFCASRDTVFDYVVPNEDSPTCRQRCDSTDGGMRSPCPAGELCTQIGRSGAGAICVEPCDPATAAGCAASELCITGTRCFDAEAARTCWGFSCPLGQICETVQSGPCVDPVTYAESHPPE